jgi:DNA-binding MarR family transcriptional regulator
MIDKDLQDQLSLTILRASLKGKYGMTAVAERNDITLQQAMTLCLLEPDTGVPMRAISEYLTCDASTVSGVVDRLVSLHFIKRKESETDRRIKLIKLTASGLRLREELLAVITEKRFPALDTLTNAELSEFIRLINKATAGASLPAPKIV